MNYTKLNVSAEYCLLGNRRENVSQNIAKIGEGYAREERDGISKEWYLKSRQYYALHVLLYCTLY